MKEYRLTDWLPTTKKEVELHGWDEVDVILFSGDAYVDHPSFGAAVIGRILEAEGLRVAIVPQPNWRDDLRDFRKLGRPRLFFGISAGCMDSMVNKYTANKRLRSDDAYTPDARPDMRPEYPSIVYTRILKQLYPDVPVVLGGIEASMRRLTHYDYWQDKVLPSILVDSGADALIYGMGEKPVVELVRRLIAAGSAPCTVGPHFRQCIADIPQMAYLDAHPLPHEDDILLFSHEECLKDKKKQAANFRHIEEESNKYAASRILQAVGRQTVVVNPPYPPLTEAELDHSFDLPYTRLPHPKYKGKRIPAYDMIKFSVNSHRGCFGGCAFCTISAHQGKFVTPRSEASVLREVERVAAMPDFRGTITDLGGPSANMYGMAGKDRSLCEKCTRPSCISPAVCANLDTSHARLRELYRRAREVKGVKHIFIGSGIRYDLLVKEFNTRGDARDMEEYLDQVVRYHVSGRLKVAPEHVSDRVLEVMRKPSFRYFHLFKQLFDRLNARAGKRQQIVPYFISSHPGSSVEDMAALAVETRAMDFRLEQVQDFTPTPMTISTDIYYSGYHPYTLRPVFTAKKPEEKKDQNVFFFWYRPENRARIARLLARFPALRKKLLG